MAYEQANDFPFKKDWNQPVPCFGAEMTKRGENVVAFSLETAYFGTPDNRVSQDNLVALGRCFAHALANFIAEQK